MRTVYRVLAYVIAALVAIQAAAIGYGVFAQMNWIENGGTLDKATLESSAPGTSALFFHAIEGFAVAVESKENVRGRLHARPEPRMQFERPPRRHQRVVEPVGEFVTARTFDARPRPARANRLAAIEPPFRPIEVAQAGRDEAGQGQPLLGRR